MIDLLLACTMTADGTTVTIERDGDNVLTIRCADGSSAKIERAHGEPALWSLDVWAADGEYLSALATSARMADALWIEPARDDRMGMVVDVLYLAGCLLRYDWWQTCVVGYRDGQLCVIERGDGDPVLDIRADGTTR